MTKEAWKNIWKEFDEWYTEANTTEPEWNKQQKKIEELVEKYN